MKIIVDVMGGDKAPEETVKGVLWAMREFNATYILVGDREAIERIAAENKYDVRLLNIVDTKTYITMEDDPISVVRSKQDSSMAVGLKMLAEGQGDAFVSTGNTGALFTGATLIVRKIKGVLRAGIGSIIPLQTPVLLLDTGANIVVTEENIEQFAVMGSAYMKSLYGIESPRVGLLNNGAEEHKGTPLQQATYKKLSENPDINFIAVEKSANVIVSACEKAIDKGLKNLVFLKCSAEYLNSYIPDNLIERIYLNFSCPFPKKKYASHRLTAAPFLKIYKRLLTANAEIHMKTDNMGLFEFSIEQLSQNGFAIKNISLDLHNSGFEGNIVTEYESKFVSLGLPIYRLEAYIKEDYCD